MASCVECIYAELQCPPIISCKIKESFNYLDSPSCEQYKHVEEKRNKD
jgi:hypothetical protein